MAVTAHVLEQQPPAEPPRERRRGLLTAGALLAVVLAAHGACLFDGVFFDDHWHRATLRSCGGTWHDLVESATFDLPGQLNDLWWQTEPLQWRYARPAAMAFMKLESILTGGRPAGIHACGLAWHWLAGLLVWRLALWAIGRPGWAFAAAVLFLLHPHAVFAVSWTAARNALVSVVFLAAAVLTYIAASAPDDPRRPLRRGMVALSLLLWAVSLLARETAIVLPAILLAIDGLRGGWLHVRRRLVVHGMVAIVAAGYLAWRLLLFPAGAVPKVYFRGPVDLSYIPWAAGKLLHMLTAEIFYTPMFVGVSTSSGAATYAVMAALLAALLAWYALRTRGVRGRWIWPIWLLAGFLPVIPVFLLPHFAYLPAIGYSISLAILLSRLGTRWQAALAVVVFASTIWSLGMDRLIWRGIIRSEQVVYADMLADGPAAPGTQMFFVNLPIANVYAAVAARDAWGVDDLAGHVLTFSPETLRMPSPSIVEVLNDRELLLSTSGPGYFSGRTGRMLLDLTRPGAPLRPGVRLRGQEFDAVVVEAGDDGITKICFTFHEPLNSPRYRFYVCSPRRPAQRLRFDTAPRQLGGEEAALFAAARCADPLERSRARDDIARMGQDVALQVAAPIQRVLAADPHLQSDESLAAVAAWWLTCDVPGLARQATRWRQANARPFAEADRYFRLMDVLGRIVHSDVFLTGNGRGR